mmetsp:Transcript_113190/g.352821  ORF Transcript_113190/g.352821 Transcript_113190/m.352821 type:complete len:190 (-) Transcript_113190:9-578(-)
MFEPPTGGSSTRDPQSASSLDIVSDSDTSAMSFAARMQRESAAAKQKWCSIAGEIMEAIEAECKCAALIGADTVEVDLLKLACRLCPMLKELKQDVLSNPHVVGLRQSSGPARCAGPSTRMGAAGCAEKMVMQQLRGGIMDNILWPEIQPRIEAMGFTADGDFRYGFSCGLLDYNLVLTWQPEVENPQQ